MRIDVLEGDITALAVDAIVNAANESLLGGGGVDGAIHRAAGPELLAECRALPEVRPGVRCPTGEARITGGHRLPARFVIHTVGPVWHGGDAGEPELLAACYANALRLAAEHEAASIAFPAISCGVFGYPHAAAAAVAVGQLRGWNGRQPERVVLACRDAGIAGEYRRLLG
ncbi:O-acetyl-ADP-ribose deacetylase [Luteimonas lutimaris]|uniref:O-acetyl-ADP-ribose deacetylase n=1 Tax=Luteimonas lutimaris TaxID=698645 RepID=A0ABP7M5U3_9GAMM|nr:O-acetyl-ADP-ribose deacetylase [Luteimonas sp.]